MIDYPSSQLYIWFLLYPEVANECKTSMRFSFTPATDMIARYYIEDNL